MKPKRIVSLLLCLMLALSLLPTAALAVTEIKTITVTIAEPVSGQPLPTNATIAEDCFQVTKVEWTESIMNGELADTVHVYLEIKPGADVKFPNEEFFLLPAVSAVYPAERYRFGEKDSQYLTHSRPFPTCKG